MVGPHSSGRYSGGPLCSIASKLSGAQSSLSQSLYALKEFGSHLLGLHAPGARLWFLSAAPGVSKLSPTQAHQSVFKWELVLPTWHDPLTINVAEFTYALNRLATNKRLLWSGYKCKRNLAYHVSGKKPKTKQQKINNPGKNDPIPNKNDDCFCSTHTTKSTAIFTLRNYCAALTIG